MQTIFEIVNCFSGKTEGFKTRSNAIAFCEKMEKYGYVRDFMPAATEGFYVVDLRGSVQAPAFDCRQSAMQYADEINEKIFSNSFRVVEHRL